jgi:putative colanic acid biosynthesis UDP-glucose lipid carrier transferase
MPEFDPTLSAASAPAARLAQRATRESGLLQGLEAVLEPGVLVLSLWALVWTFDRQLEARWIIAAVVAFALAYPGRRRLPQAPGSVFAGVLFDWVWIAGLLLAMGFATGHIRSYDPEVVAHWLWVAPAAQLAAHWALRLGAPRLVRLQGPPRRAVVVGLNEQGRALADRLAATPWSDIELVGCFDDRRPDQPRGSKRHRYLGRMEDLPRYANAHRIDLIYLSLPMATTPRTTGLLETLKDTTASVYFVPDMFVTDLIQGHSDSVCGVPVISVWETPFRGVAGFLKRTSDIVLASIALLLLSPIMLAAAIAVKVSSPGPVIFRQRRYGLGGEEIIVYKFRSMTVTEDGDRIEQARRNDERVTRVGAFLRRTSIDELPQFINVLQGRMSVVGPRPHAVAHNEMYRGLIKSYMLRHKVRPGITGWAQVNGLRGETETLEKMEARVRCDLEYLRNWSLRLDLLIIWRTVLLVFRDAAAY